MKDDQGENFLTRPEAISKQWRRYFQGLQKDGELVANEDSQQIQDKIIRNHEEDISVKEVREAMEKIKNGKVPGEDGLPVEIIKVLGENGIVWLKKIINDA